MRKNTPTQGLDKTLNGNAASFSEIVKIYTSFEVSLPCGGCS